MNTAMNADLSHDIPSFFKGKNPRSSVVLQAKFLKGENHALQDHCFYLHRLYRLRAGLPQRGYPGKERHLHDRPEEVHRVRR
jgi:hypothetical protein